jgi:hypothetical protein
MSGNPTTRPSADSGQAKLPVLVSNSLDSYGNEAAGVWRGLTHHWVRAGLAVGLAISAMKIQRGDNFVTDMLGPHGLVFGVVLPLAVYLIVPTVIIWIVAWAVSLFRK